MMDHPDRRTRIGTAWRAYAGFAVFGGFWGTWGAAVPVVRDLAQVGDGRLGTALLLVGAGALPAMLLAGRAIDRWGHLVTGVGLGGLALSGLLLAVLVRDMVTLSAALLIVGAASGAADVGINTLAGSAERASGAPVILRAQGTFSAMVVVSSLLTGQVLTGGGLVRPFAALAVIGVALAVPVATGGDMPRDDMFRDTAPADRIAGPLRRMVLVLGALAALGYAVENAHQSWGAVFLTDVAASGPATAAWAPAAFAAAVAITRLTVSALPELPPVRVLLGGSVVAAGGTIALATSTTPVTALTGLALAAAGTAVLFPTILSVVTARVGDERRGRATSLVTVVAYLGFLFGPVYVGWWSEATSLPGAMIAVGGLAALLAVLTVPVMRATAGVGATLPGRSDARRSMGSRGAEPGRPTDGSTHGCVACISRAGPGRHQPRHGEAMAMSNENIEEAGGRVKEAAGSLLDDEDLKEEGAAQQDKASAEQKAEQAEREAIDARKEAAAHEERQERA